MLLCKIEMYLAAEIKLIYLVFSAYFYAPGLKGPPGAYSVWIVCPSVCPSVRPSVRLSVRLSVSNSVPLINKVQ